MRGWAIGALLCLAGCAAPEPAPEASAAGVFSITRQQPDSAAGVLIAHTEATEEASDFCAARHARFREVGGGGLWAGGGQVIYSVRFRCMAPLPATARGAG